MKHTFADGRGVRLEALVRRLKISMQKLVIKARRRVHMAGIAKIVGIEYDHWVYTKRNLESVQKTQASS